MKLGRVKGLGPCKIQALCNYFGSIDKIFDASALDLLDSRIFKEKMLPEWEKLKNASDENFLNVIYDCHSRSIAIVPLIDSLYPKKLRKISSPPLTLFLWGNATLLEKGKRIAIVGTRKPSEEAKKFALEFSDYFSKLSVTIISGGAEGIDTMAHEGALSSGVGNTICVFGTGLLHAFPPQNAVLFERIKNSNGLLITEHLPNFSGSRISFLQRNRITSGLSDALLVCASNVDGGSMVQTKIAWEQRIPIFCPAISLNIKPNEGSMIAIKKYNTTEISSPSEMENKIMNRKTIDTY